MNKLRNSLPSLSSLLPFEASARLGSVSRAAEELNITQAAVSRQIRLLEEDLGVELFERRNRGVYLTEAGRQFSRVLSNALGDVAREADRLRRVAGTNQVVLLCQMSEAFYWLMPRLNRFHQRHPDIEVRINTLTRALCDYEGYFDVAMQSSNRSRGDHPLLFTASDEVFPVCSPAYLARFGNEPLGLDTLDQHTLLHHQTHPQYELEWDTWLAAHGYAVPMCKSLSFDSYSMMIQAALAGHGLAMGWQRTAQAMLERGELVAPFSQSIELPGAITVCGRQGQGRRRETERFAEWLAEELA